MDPRVKLAVFLYLRRRLRRPRERRFWNHPICRERTVYGEYHHLFRHIMSDDEKCIAYLRMNKETFKTLLNHVGPAIVKETTNFRKPISPEERLVITLTLILFKKYFYCCFHNTVHSSFFYKNR